MIFLSLLAAATPAAQIASEGKDKVVQIGTPIIALGVALLVFILVIVLIRFISGQLDRSQD